ncbi:UNVERIFIED_CONTAM: hypothetical protein HDU68_000966, partial [Siphonaria sp. JEL0065]
WASRGLYSLVPQPVVAHAAQVQTRGLILSSGGAAEVYPQYTFNSYGLDYDTLIYTPSNLSTSPLNLEVTPNVLGRYSVIVLANGQLGATFPNGSFLSVLSPSQWTQIHNYQQYYGVRLVAIDDVPTAPVYAGKVAAFGGATSCNSASLNVSPSNKNFTDAAGLKNTWSLPVGENIPGSSCNFPSTVIDAAAVTPVLTFNNTGVAAAVIDFGRNQQQMSFFHPCGFWSTTCATVGNIWFQWATKGLYTGIRRLYFTPQIDDVFLTTDGNDENGKAVGYRASVADIQGLIAWMPSINSRLPAGSNIVIEMAFNGLYLISTLSMLLTSIFAGNGVLERFANSTDWYIDIDPDLTDTNLDWIKPLGTGQSLWPNLSKVNSSWAASVLATDPLYNMFSAPGALTTVTNKFFWVSHTFTHEIFNNNTYSDVTNEITFNFNLASKKYWGLDGQPFWSNNSIVTPGISGIFNGDALKALSDFGIKGCVGDSSRNKTVDANRPLWWPLTTTVANNNFAGFTVIPRQSLAIYFNATNANYNAQLYNNIYGTKKTFADVLVAEVDRNMRTLAFLSWNPAMFHQANLRNADLPTVTVGSGTGKFGLMQQWVEAVFGTWATIANWPVISLKQDDLTQKFINCQAYETAGVNVVQLVSVTQSGVIVTGFNVTASKTVVAPVTLPPSIGLKNITALPAGATTEQIGIDSLTIWIPLKAGAVPVSIVFGTPIVQTTVCFPAWSATVGYPGSSTVSHNSINYKSKWYENIGYAPGAATGDGGWVSSGPCVVATVTTTASATATPGVCFAAWKSTVGYNSGSSVSYNGVNYQSKWYENINSAPGAGGDGGWISQGACVAGPTSTTSVVVTKTGTATATTSVDPIIGTSCTGFGSSQCINHARYQCGYYTANVLTWGSWGTC